MVYSCRICQGCTQLRFLKNQMKEKNLWRPHEGTHPLPALEQAFRARASDGLCWQFGDRYHIKDECCDKKSNILSTSRQIEKTLSQTDLIRENSQPDRFIRCNCCEARKLEHTRILALYTVFYIRFSAEPLAASRDTANRSNTLTQFSTLC